MRFRDNAWRPIPAKEKLYNTLSENYTAIYRHVQDNIDNYIGYEQTSGDLFLVNMSTGAGTLIKEYTPTLPVRVQFLKRFMLVIHATGIDKYLYDSTSGYRLMNIAYPPKMTLVADGAKYDDTEMATTAEGLLGKWRKYLIEASETWSYLHGGIMYRMAYRLYDGTYVMHTIPEFLQIAPLTGSIQKVSGAWKMWLNTAYLYASIDRTYYHDFVGENMKDIISSVCLFVSKNEPLYDINDTVLTDAVLAGVTTSKYFGQLFQINDDFKKLADSVNWYKVLEIPFTKASNVYAGLTEAIDMKGFYLDYTSKENLTVDNFTAHGITANTSFEYNDRLILGDVTTFFGEHYQHTIGHIGYDPTRYTIDYTFRQSYLLFTISTDSGVKYQLTAIGGYYSTRNSDAQLVAIFNDFVIGYPDARCTEARLITADDGGNFYFTHTFTMKKSANDNYAYYHSESFSGDNTLAATDSYNFAKIIVEINFTAGNEVNLETYQNKNTYRDMNRVQVSELRNPYYFPAKNSYQVGSGQIIGIGTNTEPISEGQFGQYPLYVFTNKGIWMLMQGSGDVVFSNVAPVSGEVANSGDQIISVGNGVVFSDERGLKLIAGKQVVRLSQAIEGPVISTFRTNNHFNFFIQDSRLVILNNNISTVDFLDYLGTAIFGFDKVNNELIISNSSYAYSYVYNFESQTFHKVSETYNLFIFSYPELYAISTEGIMNLSSETGTAEVNVLIATQPMSCELPEVYKKIERAILRCQVVTKLATYVTFGIWATDDLKTFQFITGGQRSGEIQNILLTRSHNSNKFYVISVFGQLSADSQISAIDISVTPRLTRKLRT